MDPLVMATLVLASSGKAEEVLRKKLKELELLGLVEDGRITTKGEELLRALISEKLTLAGTVVSGEGEGKYFLSLEGYRKQIEEKMGFSPYPGTLNVLLDPESAERRLLMYFKRPITLKGFEENGRRFGEVLTYPAKINDFWPAAIVVPLKTHHPPEIVEVIAPVNLRKELSLKNGDKVKIIVF
ncbi:riboflavin kinase [Ignicoccus pacificus DSM 13166]|uniref:Riboflavin kinase n=1 Tax=Ignicoccus pacificus DSM 13166 TaxID=940294 RepID=A0A977KAJ6_9CREN|nr:riboflavin kinase [Ignicoccus pacificus DSM 13166]